MSEKISPTRAIEVGWEAMKKKFWFFVGVLVLVFLIQVIPTAIAGIFKHVITLYFMILLASLILQIIVRIGLVKISLDIFDKGDGHINDLFSQAHLLGKFILGMILYALIVIGGFILLIVPGIIWSIKYQFFAYLIIDKNMGPLEAIKKSGEITMGNKGNLFVLGILISLINLVGVLCAFVGLFATIPLSLLAMVYVYRKLMGEIPTAAETPGFAISAAPEQAA
ncbi:MAG: hypothetical protein P4L62_04135 [Candidatus Pacebacteria bacterium]|nr:hypothetical protein [Candidatus Paceibacterota bacterium]MDR3583520.1 hypothetical protein [Candidatus Paceibacterota bacterium]